jgi:hypothetical protein
VTSLQLRRLRCLDGLHYSFQVLHLSYESLWPACCAIPKDNANAIAAISCCWTYIDALHRIREIAQGTPGLSVKHAEVRVFLDATALAEKMRHYMQHLRGELNRDPPNPFPVWGSLAWVDPDDRSLSYMALLGCQFPGVQITGCVWDTHNACWVSNVCLGIADSSFNFDTMHAAAKRFEAFVLPDILNSLPEEVRRHDVLPIHKIKVVQPSPNKSLQRSVHHKVLGRGRVVSAPDGRRCARVLTSQPAAAELSR